MEKSKNDVWVGLFVLLGTLAVLFLALQSANLLSLSFQPTYQVVAKFDNIGGLKPRAAVKGAGVVVGRVESIAFDDKSFQARVTLALQAQYAFPKDSSLKNLKSGDAISSTQSAVVLENLISQFLYSKAEGGGNPAKPSAPSK
jgi:phospholipid/cholesterol/gamma-HCH transport system substrate-binding protein